MAIGAKKIYAEEENKRNLKVNKKSYNEHGITSYPTFFGNSNVMYS